MSPLLEKPPEPVEKIRAPAKISEALAPHPGPGSTQAQPAPSSRYRATVVSAEPSSGDRPEEPVRLTMSRPEQGIGRSSRLRASFEALGKLRSSRLAGDWLEAAMALKNDAVQLRRTHLARHADVCLSIADALTFTDPEEQTIDAQSFSALRQSLALLSEPFISEAAEEKFMIGLLRSGWHLAPAVDPEAPAA